MKFKFYGSLRAASLLSVVLFFVAFASAQDAVINVGRELCDDSVQGASPDVSSGSFTVAVRAKILAPGAEKGNGDSLGMIYNVATGWYDGFRTYYDWRNGRFTFQIGQENGANGCSSDPSYRVGAMRDIVTVCDAQAKRLTLYVDGKAVAGCPHVCEIKTNGAKLNVGFGGAGVGSNRMFVDKLEYWKRALTPEEIAERNAARPKEELATVRALDKIPFAVGNSARIDDLQELRDALKLDLPEDAKEAIRKDLLNAALYAKKYDEAAPILLENIDAYLDEAKGKSVDANEEPTNAAISRYFEARTNLEKLLENVKDAKTLARAKNAFDSLKKAYPREEQVVQDVDKLEASAERVRNLEKLALQEFQKTREKTRFMIDIYVAPYGSDETGDGSSKKPFASVARAFERVQAEGKDQKNAGFIVRMARGVYQVEKTAKLQGVGNVVVTPSVAGGKVVLTGGRVVDNFQTLEQAARQNADVAEIQTRFQADARAKIFVADLEAAGVKNFGSMAARGYGAGDAVAPIPSLHLGGESQTLAQWPNVGEERVAFGAKAEPSREKADDGTNLDQGSTFAYDYDRPNGWKLSGDGSQDDVWAFGLYVWEWAANLRKVLAIDREKKQITFDYPNGSGRFDYYFVNILEELDAPGEFFVDKKNGTLYFYPPKEITTVDALNQARVEYDEFEGRFFELENAKSVLILGLEMKCGRETAVVAQNCDHCYVQGCRIEQFGGNAVVMNGGKYCGVFQTKMRELGAGGVRFSGGDRKTLEPCVHCMHDCVVRDFSRIDRVYTPALHAFGCGFVATSNTICDSPHHGFRTDGNDIYIARNEVHSVVYEYSDQAGIDIFCDPSYRGIVIEQNLWRHIGSAFALCGQAGIRLDDTISGVVMLDNVFYRSSGGFFGGIQIHGGKDNLCRGNLFVDCKQAFSFSPWGVGRYEQFVKERFPENVDNPKYLETYPFFDQLFAHYNRNYILENYAVNCGRFNQNGDGLNVFAENKSWTETPDLKALGVESAESYADVFLTNPTAMKKWFGRLLGRDFGKVGSSLIEKEPDDLNVSPNFIGVK